jgi:hypothetical protein
LALAVAVALVVVLATATAMATATTATATAAWGKLNAPSIEIDAVFETTQNGLDVLGFFELFIKGGM